MHVILFSYSVPFVAGDDWEHKEIFTDDDEAVGINPKEREEFEPEVPAPPEIKQVRCTHFLCSVKLGFYFGIYYVSLSYLVSVSFVICKNIKGILGQAYWFCSSFFVMFLVQKGVKLRFICVYI